MMIGEEYDDGARYVVGEGDGGAALFSLSLNRVNVTFLLYQS